MSCTGENVTVLARQVRDRARLVGFDVSPPPLHISSILRTASAICLWSRDVTPTPTAQSLSVGVHYTVQRAIMTHATAGVHLRSTSPLSFPTPPPWAWSEPSCALPDSVDTAQTWRTPNILRPRHRLAVLPPSPPTHAGGIPTSRSVAAHTPHTGAATYNDTIPLQPHSHIGHVLV